MIKHLPMNIEFIKQQIKDKLPDVSYICISEHCGYMLNANIKYNNNINLAIDIDTLLKLL